MIIGSFPEITFVCFKWEPVNHRYKQIRRFKNFNARHVNILYGMISRNFKKPFRFVCVTDEHDEINSQIEIYPLWEDFKKLGGCYTRLKIFDKETSESIADGSKYIVGIDLDTVITGDLTSFLDPEKENVDLVTWYRPGENNPHCGAFWMLKPGSCHSIWDDFSEKKVKEVKTKHADPRKDLLLSGGTDQAWINHKIRNDNSIVVSNFYPGFYDFKRLGKEKTLPDNAKIVFFNGRRLMPENFKHLKWVRENYHE